MKFTMGSNQIKSFTAFFSINLAYLCSCIYVDRLFLPKGQHIQTLWQNLKKLPNLDVLLRFKVSKEVQERKVQRLTGDS